MKFLQEQILSGRVVKEIHAEGKPVKRRPMLLGWKFEFDTSESDSSAKGIASIEGKDMIAINYSQADAEGGIVIGSEINELSLTRIVEQGMFRKRRTERLTWLGS